MSGSLNPPGSLLSGVFTQAAAHQALGLGGAATLNVGTAAGTVAAGNDSRLVGALQAGNNLSDISSVSAARASLGLAGMATQAPGSVAITGGSIAGISSLSAAGPINTTSTSGFQIGAITVVNLYGVNNSTVAVGRNTALASAGTVGTFSTYVGDSAGMNTLPAAGENTMLGSNAGAFNINGGQNAYVGCVAGRVEQSGENVIIGCDAGRDIVSPGSNTAIGQNAQRSGGGTGNTSVGQGALQGNSSAITFSGTQTAGDVVTLIFNAPASTVYGNSYAALVNVPVSVTVTAGMTSPQLAAAMLTAINATSILNTSLAGLQAYTGSGANQIRFSFAGTATTGSLCVITSSVSGAATEVVSITGGAVGNYNVAIGGGALNGVNLTNASNNVAVGFNTLLSLISGNSNIAIGYEAGQQLLSGSGNVLIGALAGYLLTTPTDNVAIGDNALAANITGAANVAIGGFAMANNVTTGAYTTAIGYGALKGATGSTSNQTVAIGGLAGTSVTTASGDVFIGFQAGQSVSSGFNSVLIGTNAGQSITTGFLNTIIGAYVSATTLTTGFGNIIIGCGATSSSLDTASSSTANTINIGGIFLASGINAPASAVARVSGIFGIGGASGPTWSSGSGAPSSVQPNGSLYSNATGTTGARLYVSNGSTWTAVASV